MNVTRLATALLFFCTHSLALADKPQCAEQALQSAKGLFSHHAGFTVQDPADTGVDPPRHLATRHSRSKDGMTLEIYEAGAWIGRAGRYTIQLSFLVHNQSCMLAGQAIQGSWVDDHFRRAAARHPK